MELTINKAKAVVRCIRKVAQEKNIDFLTRPAYQFITLKLGFIAHYDLSGFREVYRDLREFFSRLQTSEYSNDKDYNIRWADRQENDSDFNKWYGEENQKNTAWTIREIVKIARQYEKEITDHFNEKQKEAELKQAEVLAGKHGYSLVEGR